MTETRGRTAVARLDRGKNVMVAVVLRSCTRYGVRLEVWYSCVGPRQGVSGTGTEFRGEGLSWVACVRIIPFDPFPSSLFSCRRKNDGGGVGGVGGGDS